MRSEFWRGYRAATFFFSASLIASSVWFLDSVVLCTVESVQSVLFSCSAIQLFSLVVSCYVELSRVW